MTDGERFKKAMDDAWALPTRVVTEGTPEAEATLRLARVDATCPAEARTGSGMKPSGPHTHRCQKIAGHAARGDPAHEWSNGAGRTVIWYGEARKQEDDTRYRYGLRPGWQMW